LVQIYSTEEVLQAKLNLLGETKMMDYVIDVFKKVHPGQDVPTVGSAA
jgi:hypothetical protein